MAENKTKPTTKSVPDFLNSIQDPVRREDCRTLAAMMDELTSSKPHMCGDYIKLLKEQ